jgi:SAM-dependent methyltransferase
MLQGSQMNRIEEVSAKYSLTYHISYLKYFLKHFDPCGKDILEVGGALPRELVIDCLGCNNWTCTESPDYDDELGEANQQTILSPQKVDHRYSAVMSNIECFDDSHIGRYDCIFSIACFEHIARLPEALEAMYRFLKPGGLLFSAFAPVWSSYAGHHLMHCKTAEQCGLSSYKEILGPWEHLLKPRYQLHKELTQRFDNAFADEIIYNTYNSPHINRYFTEDYMEVIYRTRFRVEEFSGTFIDEVPDNMRQALEVANPGYKMFANQGITLRLLKT